MYSCHSLNDAVDDDDVVPGYKPSIFPNDSSSKSSFAFDGKLDSGSFITTKKASGRVANDLVGAKSNLESHFDHFQ